MLKYALFAASAALVTAQNSTTDAPCAVVAAHLQEASIIPAQEAFDCLNSVPVDIQGNSKLIDELKILWGEFYSELIWLKNPGSDWEYGPLDILRELDKIKNSLSSFQSEYVVQVAIEDITFRTGNFHFNYVPDILQIFKFRREFNVASISSDGKALPKLYVHEDVEAVAEGRNSVSDISSINGQDPYDFLKSSAFTQYIDSDGLVNSMLKKGDTDSPGAFERQYRFDGNSTDVTWSNGSSASAINLALTQKDFSGVTDGTSFFKKFCTGAINGTGSGNNIKSKDVISPSGPGPVPRIPAGIYHRRNKRQTIPTNGTYPSAVAESQSSVVSGYFLNGNGYDDVAVLKIISFANPDPDSTEGTDFSNDFQDTVAEFLSQCISQSKQKLIIDLRENGGGDTNLLLDTFMQLFPEMDPFSGQQYRASEAFVKIGDAVNEIRSNSSLAAGYQQFRTVFFFRYWAWWHFRTAEGDNFSGWDQFNGPLNLNSDKFTETMRYNYSNADRVSILPDGFNFVNGTRPTAFNSSNIVMYTDALCGSSCASFHEELKNIAGIKAVTVGGRPENRPIQTITGSKGGEVINLIRFSQYASVALNVSSRIGLASISRNDPTLEAVANVPTVSIRAGDDFTRSQSQNQIRKGDKTATPLQFIYEASDCKIFYTALTYADPDAAWKQAWDAFQDDTQCVEGSTKHKSSISGGFKPYGSAVVADEDQPAEPGNPSDHTGDAARIKTNALTMVIAFMVVAITINAPI